MIMKKKLITLSFAAAMLMFSACDSNKQETVDQDQEQAIAEATRQELATAVADRDQLLSLVTEISESMDQIKQMENILTVSSGNSEDAQARRQQVQADIQAIQATLQERRERLAALEKKLSNSNLTNSNLRKTIESLRSQIDSQSKEIESLRNNLADATARIGELDAQVENLNETVSTVTTEKEEAQQKSTELANELNTCFYAVGSNSELKSHKIIESGFLKKTKLMKGEFDQSFFTTADKRTLTTIHLHSSKAEVLTNQPKDSYAIEDVNGQKVLRITNSQSFWSLSNYLVIKID
jgi:chromosome segregation ATPase